MVCSPYTGCHLNSNRIVSACTINISAITSIQFFGRVLSNSFKFNANYIDLIFSTAVKYPLSPPLSSSLPSIPIQYSATSEIFHSSNKTNSLIEISLANLSCNNFNFYTDGSVIDIGTNQCSMGIGWVQVDDNNHIINKFSAKIHL